MGKDSLLESTSKKKAGAKADKEKPAKKKTAAKKSTSTKKSAKSKTPAKGKKAASGKGAAKAHNPASKTQARKPTRKELLWKKFETDGGTALFTPAAPAKPASSPDAPSYFSGMNAADAKKAKEYLWRRFDWAQIEAAGEKYAAQLAAEAEKDAKRKAEEDAKRKAEEDAKRKAEEDAKRKAEEDAKRKAEEDAKRKADAQLPPPPPPAESDVGGSNGFNPVKIGIIAFCAIILLLVVSSYSNTRKYYIQEKDGAVEIWRGTFTPMGQTRLMILPGIQMPPEQKDVYGWQDAYRLMYQYYIDRADAILEVPEVPDTVALTANLEKAIQFAPDRELRDAARSRLIGIHMQTLVHKAQAALNRGSVESAAEAVAYLEEAARLELSPADAEMVQRKLADANNIRADREMAQAAAQQAADEETALEQDARKLEEAADNPSPTDE